MWLKSNILILLYCAFVSHVTSRGVMVEPPQRSSLWRDPDFRNKPMVAVDNEDSGLNCGGFWRLHGINLHRCGLCGDPYDKVREHEAGGKYAQGYITRHYGTSDKYINVTINVVFNIGGHFQFQLCPNNNVYQKVTEDCFDQYPLTIRGHGDKFRPRREGDINLSLKIPSGVTCSQCVLRWKWRGGNYWGQCSDGLGDMGCGDQEEYYNCADIAITTSRESKIEGIRTTYTNTFWSTAAPAISEWSASGASLSQILPSSKESPIKKHSVTSQVPEDIKNVDFNRVKIIPINSSTIDFRNPKSTVKSKDFKDSLSKQSKAPNKTLVSDKNRPLNETTTGTSTPSMQGTSDVSVTSSPSSVIDIFSSLNNALKSILRSTGSPSVSMGTTISPMETIFNWLQSSMLSKSDAPRDWSPSRNVQKPDGLLTDNVHHNVRNESRNSINRWSIPLGSQTTTSSDVNVQFFPSNDVDSRLKTNNDIKTKDRNLFGFGALEKEPHNKTTATSTLDNTTGFDVRTSPGSDPPVTFFPNPVSFAFPDLNLSPTVPNTAWSRSTPKPMTDLPVPLPLKEPPLANSGPYSLYSLKRAETTPFGSNLNTMSVEDSARNAVNVLYNGQELPGTSFFDAEKLFGGEKLETKSRAKTSVNMNNTKEENFNSIKNVSNNQIANDNRSNFNNFQNNNNNQINTLNEKILNYDTNTNMEKSKMNNNNIEDLQSGKYNNLTEEIQNLFRISSSIKTNLPNHTLDPNFNPNSSSPQYISGISNLVKPEMREFVHQTSIDIKENVHSKPIALAQRQTMVTSAPESTLTNAEPQIKVKTTQDQHIKPFKAKKKLMESPNIAIRVTIKQIKPDNIDIPIPLYEASRLPSRKFDFIGRKSATNYKKENHNPTTNLDGKGNKWDYNLINDEDVAKHGKSRSDSKTKQILTKVLTSLKSRDDSTTSAGQLYKFLRKLDSKASVGSKDSPQLMPKTLAVKDNAGGVVIKNYQLDNVDNQTDTNSVLEGKSNQNNGQKDHVSPKPNMADKYDVRDIRNFNSSRELWAQSRSIFSIDMENGNQENPLIGLPWDKNENLKISKGKGDSKRSSKLFVSTENANLLSTTIAPIVQRQFIPNKISSKTDIQSVVSNTGIFRSRITTTTAVPITTSHLMWGSGKNKYNPKPSESRVTPKSSSGMIATDVPRQSRYTTQSTTSFPTIFPPRSRADNYVNLQNNLPLTSPSPPVQEKTNSRSSSLPQYNYQTLESLQSLWGTTVSLDNEKASFELDTNPAVSQLSMQPLIPHLGHQDILQSSPLKRSNMRTGSNMNYVPNAFDTTRKDIKNSRSHIVYNKNGIVITAPEKPDMSKRTRPEVHLDSPLSNVAKTHISQRLSADGVSASNVIESKNSVDPSLYNTGREIIPGYRADHDPHQSIEMRPGADNPPLPPGPIYKHKRMYPKFRGMGNNYVETEYSIRT